MAFLVLVFNLFFLQKINYSLYKKLSDNNRTQIDLLPAMRGNIVDRSKHRLAYQTFSYHLIINNNTITLQEIQGLKKVLPHALANLIVPEQHTSTPYTTLKYNLSAQDIAKLSVVLFEYPSVSIKPLVTRVYPYQNLLAHTLGYVGQPTEKDIKINPELRKTNTLIGKNGIEKYYNRYLAGITGQQKKETNALGKTVQNLHDSPAIPGNTVQLTVDIELQAAAEKALGKHNGVVIVTQPKTGDILVLASHPSYNLNDLVNPQKNNNYQSIYSQPNYPLFNRALKGQYSPGSTVKPLISLFALQNHFTTPTQEYFDKGWFQLKNSSYKYHDWKRNGHGWMTISDAITESCSTVFYELAYKIGIDNLNHYYKQFGFSHPILHDFPNEKEGIIPSRTWKEKQYHQPWYIGETLIAGIGQGYVSVTPIQLANMITIISNRGKKTPLHLVKNIYTHRGHTIPIPNFRHTRTTTNAIHFSNKTWNLVINAMKRVTSAPKGTAFRYFHNTNYEVAGKTGTAQVSIAKTKTSKSYLQNNSLFVGFSPITKPNIAMIVLLENNHGAAAIAREVFDAYYANLNSNRNETHEKLAFT